MCQADNQFDKFFTSRIRRVCFPRKNELDGTLWIVDDFIQAVQIFKQQGRAFVGGKAAGESNGQHVGAQNARSLFNGHHVKALAGKLAF